TTIRLPSFLDPGTEGDDVILGSYFEDVIYAKGGNDTVTTFESDDAIDGGSGNDIIDAGAGYDVRRVSLGRVALPCTKFAQNLHEFSLSLSSHLHKPMSCCLQGDKAMHCGLYPE
ncbi:MAG: hypothetical protein AB1649_23015, partial [Chloroflexota bacterium]